MLSAVSLLFVLRTGRPLAAAPQVTHYPRHVGCDASVQSREQRPSAANATGYDADDNVRVICQDHQGPARVTRAGILLAFFVPSAELLPGDPDGLFRLDVESIALAVAHKLHFHLLEHVRHVCTQALVLKGVEPQFPDVSPAGNGAVLAGGVEAPVGGRR